MKAAFWIIDILIGFSVWFDDFFQKVCMSFFASCLIVPLIYFGELFNIYIAFDTTFITLLLMFLTGSLVAGVWKHKKVGTYSGRKMMWGFIEQLFIVSIASILCNGFVQLKEFHGHEGAITYFNMSWKVTILVYLAISVGKSLVVISDGKFPPRWIMKLLDKVNKTGKIKELIQK